MGCMREMADALWEGHTLLKTEPRYTQRVQTSAEHRMTQLVSNPEDPDFGLWTPRSEA